MTNRNLSLFFLSFFLFFSCTQKTSEPAIEKEDEFISYLALGDSYTIGESVTPAERFPVVLANELEEAGLTVAEPTIIAKTGWTTTNLQNALNGEALENKYDLVSLLIGVNNQYQGKSITVYKKEFTALLLEAIRLGGNSKENVFVVSIPDYGFTPYGRSNQEAISAEIDRFNAVNKQVSDSVGVNYFNITPISRNGLSDPSLVAEDGLHPSGKMYRQWVELMVGEVKALAESP